MGKTQLTNPEKASQGFDPKILAPRAGFTNNLHHPSHDKPLRYYLFVEKYMRHGTSPARIGLFRTEPCLNGIASTVAVESSILTLLG